MEDTIETMLGEGRLYRQTDSKEAAGTATIGHYNDA